MTSTYENDDIYCMKISAKARNKSRIQELIDYAKLCGYTKLGIANCFSMQKYANSLKDILEEADFQVFSKNCKESCLDGKELAPELAGPICDPISQAEYLNECGTELNINLGLCLGHGLLFQKHSKAEVTTVVVKDPITGHRMIVNLE